MGFLFVNDRKSELRRIALSLSLPEKPVCCRSAGIMRAELITPQRILVPRERVDERRDDLSLSVVREGYIEVCRCLDARGYILCARAIRRLLTTTRGRAN